MKRTLTCFALLFPMILQADIIVKKSGERLEDVHIKSFSGSEIIYTPEDGDVAVLMKSDVSAILYDDGRYEEFNQTSETPSEDDLTTHNSSEQVMTPQNYVPSVAEEWESKEYNVWAYGVYAGVGYFSKDENDGFKVEYRIIYKDQIGEPEFAFLGTTPFAYATEKMDQASFVGRGNPYLMSLLEQKPFIVPNDKKVKKIEFRLSKKGYKTTIVKPFRDVLIGGGPLLMISLDKIRPLKDGEIDDIVVTQESKSQDQTLQYSSEPDTAESEPMEEYYQQQNNKVYDGEEYLGGYEDEPIENQESHSSYALEPEPEPEPIQKRGIEFRASKSFVEFTETGGETRIEITSDEAWEITEMPSWVDTRQKSDALIINVAQNERTSDREGDIVLLNKHQTELRIVVAQGRNNDYLKLSAQGIDDTEGVGGAYTIKVNSNKAWDAKTDADWCTIEKSGENFVVRLASNMSGKKRETTIEVTAYQSVIAKQVFQVKQSPQNHYITIDPSSVTSKGKKGIITINVTTDMSKYRIEDVPDWCSISQMKANSFTLEIADNSGGAAREAQIKVAIDGGKSKILTVQQEELLNYVSVSPKIITASPRGGIITVHVEGSGAWRVVNLPDWCQTTDLTNDSFTLIIEKNDTDAPRNASFSVSVNGVREQIEVRQQ